MPRKKCRVCGKTKMLTDDGRCCWCGYPPHCPLSKEWKELRKKLLPKQQAEDRDFLKRLKKFKKLLKPKTHIDI